MKLSAQEIYRKCQRCCEAGADHYIDKDGNLKYCCENCQYYNKESE